MSFRNGLFIGSFFSPTPEATVTNPVLSMEGPDGSAECPCERYSYAPGDPEGEPARAGDYTFHNTGSDVGTGLRELFLGGADVMLPETLDLSVLSLEVAGGPGTLPVGQDALIEVTTVVANAGPFGPVEARVNIAGAGGPDGRAARAPDDSPGPRRRERGIGVRRIPGDVHGAGSSGAHALGVGRVPRRPRPGASQQQSGPASRNQLRLRPEVASPSGDFTCVPRMGFGEDCYPLSGPSSDRRNSSSRGSKSGRRYTGSGPGHSLVRCVSGQRLAANAV